MRFTRWALGVVGVGAFAASGVAGCGSSNSATTSSSTSTGSTSASTSTSSSTSTSTSTSTSSSTSGGGGAGPGCEVTPACMVADKTCLGLTQNTGLTKFGLRMAELDIGKPAALATGPIGLQVGGAVTPMDAACNL